MRTGRAETTGSARPPRMLDRVGAAGTIVVLAVHKPSDALRDDRMC